MCIARSLLVLVLALLAAACGDDGDKDSRRGGDGTPELVAAELRIRLENVGDKSNGGGLPTPKGVACDRSIPATCRGEVSCPGDDDEICRWLSRRDIQDLLLSKPPLDEVCTEIYGGPETATVTGTLGARPVKRTFSRTNGCEISRFDKASPLWTGEVPRNEDAERDVHVEPEVIDDPPEAFDY